MRKLPGHRAPGAPEKRVDNKLVWEGRVDSQSNGAEAQYALRPRAGGRLCKTELLQVKVVAGDANANTRISVYVRHSPDGTVSVAHSTAINSAAPGTTLPALLSGYADQALPLGEYLHLVLGIADSGLTTARWAYVQVWGMRKPF